MKPFKDIEQPIDKTRNVLRIIAPVEVDIDLNPYDLFDAFYDLCEQKGWVCKGGGAQFPDDDPTMQKKDVE